MPRETVSGKSNAEQVAASAFKLKDGLCPDCGGSPEDRGYESSDDDVLGDLCTHPRHDEVQ